MKKVWIFIFMFCSQWLSGQVSDTIDIPLIEFRYKQLYTPLYQAQARILDSTELSVYTGHTLSQLLSQESHTTIKSYGPSSLSTVSFRGKAASHTGLYWNGIRINSPLVGQVDMNTIPINAINRLAIYTGNTSLMTGSGDLGGSIALLSNLTGLCADCPRGEKLRIGGLQQIGSYGRHSTTVTYQQAGKDLNIGLSIYHELAQNDFEFLNTAIRVPRIDTQSNAGYRQMGVTASLQYIPPQSKHNVIKDTLNFSIWYQKYERNIPPLMPDLGVKRNETQNDQSLRASLQYRLRKKEISHDFNLGLNSENTRYMLSFLVPHQKPYEQFNALSNYSSLQFNYDMKFILQRNHHLQLSTRNRYQWARYKEKKNSAHFLANRFSTEIQASYLKRITSQIHTEIVGNMTRYFPGQSQINGSAGIFYQLRNLPEAPSTWMFGLEMGRNTHQPTLNDLYWEPGGNPDLKTEKSLEVSLPIAYEYRRGKTRLSLRTTPYYSHVKDWILWKPSRYYYWTPRNVRSVRSTGVEADFDWTYTGKNILSTVGSYYSFSPTLDNTFGESLNIYYQQLPYIPLHQYRLTYSLFFIPSNLGITYALRVNGARYVDSPFVGKRAILNSYLIQDLQVTYSLKIRNLRSKIFFRIDNLWDIDYQSIQWRPMPGRNYTLLIHLKFSK